MVNDEITENTENVLVFLSVAFKGPMHSYREAFEDDKADGFADSPTFGGGGGENSPQTPSFPVSPQTPYFNMCRSTLPAGRGRSHILITPTFTLNSSRLSFIDYKRGGKNMSRISGKKARKYLTGRSIFFYCYFNYDPGSSPVY